MSAPASSYDLRLLKRKTSPAENFQIAKLLSAYIDYSTAKTLFHLDKILPMKDVSTLGLLFVGLVFPGGSNEAFHAVARKGNTKIQGHYALLDAGLNCKPERPTFFTTGGISTSINVLDNSILLYASFKSAYYDSTTAQITAAESLNLNINETLALGSCDANDTLTLTNALLLFPTIIFTVGKQYAITLKAENTEGVTNSVSALQLSPAPAAVNMKFGSTINAAIAAQSAGTVYISRTLKNVTSSSGLVFYANLQASSYVSTGYYLSIVANELGRYPYYRVTTTGQVTEVGEVVSRHHDVYYYYSAISAGNAIQGSPVERILYYEVEITPPGSDFEYRTYFDGPFASSNYAAQGYYVKADRTTDLYVGASGSAQVFVGS